MIVGQSFMKGSPFEAGMIKDGVDQTMVEGASTLPYQIPNLRVSAHMAEVGVPTLWWRSVGSTHTAFSTETFLDQLADATGNDPFQLRRKLLTLALAKPGIDGAGKERVKRHLGVLELAAEKAGWGQPLPKGRTRGIAVHESFKSFVAHVVEVSMGEDGLPKVERVVAAADCGIPINPDVIRAQLEGGMGFGLSAALFSSIDLEDGRVRAVELPRLPRVAYQRDAGHRGAYRALQREPDRYRGAWHAADRTGNRQRLVEAHGPARVHAAVLAFGGQGLRRCV